MCDQLVTINAIILTIILLQVHSVAIKEIKSHSQVKHRCSHLKNSPKKLGTPIG